MLYSAQFYKMHLTKNCGYKRLEKKYKPVPITYIFKAVPTEQY